MTGKELQIQILTLKRENILKNIESEKAKLARLESEISKLQSKPAQKTNSSKSSMEWK